MTHVRQAILLLCAGAWIAIVCAAGGCGSNNDEGGAPDAAQYDSTETFGVNDGGGLFGGDDGGIPAPCPGGGIECYVPPGCTTSLSGTDAADLTMFAASAGMTSQPTTTMFAQANQMPESVLKLLEV